MRSRWIQELADFIRERKSRDTEEVRNGRNDGEEDLQYRVAGGCGYPAFRDNIKTKGDWYL